MRTDLIRRTLCGVDCTDSKCQDYQTIHRHFKRLPIVVQSSLQLQCFRACDVVKHWSLREPSFIHAALLSADPRDFRLAESTRMMVT